MSRPGLLGSTCEEPEKPKGRREPIAGRWPYDASIFSREDPHTPVPAPGMAALSCDAHQLNKCSGRRRGAEGILAGRPC